MPVQTKTKRKAKSGTRSQSGTSSKPGGTIRKKKTATPQIVTIDPLRKLPWLVHGFSTRPGGFSQAYGAPSLNLGFTKEDRRETVERNRALFLQMLGVTKHRGPKHSTPMSLVTLRQVHSDLIHTIASAPKQLAAGDGMITNVPGLILAVQTADCLPVILVDPKRKAVGVFHAGWRGTLKRIVEKGVGEMLRNFGSEPRHMQAAIGPGIGKCCFEVGPEVRVQFEAQFAYASALFREIKELDPVREKYPMLFLTARAPGHSELPSQLFLDLAEANRLQLLAAGLSARNIHVSPLCTACRTDILYSYREGRGVTGRMMGAVGIRP